MAPPVTSHDTDSKEKIFISIIQVVYLGFSNHRPSLEPGQRLGFTAMMRRESIPVRGKHTSKHRLP